MTTSPQSDLRLIRINDLANMIGYHRSSINHMVAEGRFPQRIVSAQYSAGHERIMKMIQWFFMFQGNSASICSTVSVYGN